MKKEYGKPKLEKFGTVKAITQVKEGSGFDADHLFDSEA